MFSVLIVADYKVRSNCLSDFGWKEDEYRFVGCATNAREIVKCCAEKKPDVMLICQNVNSVLEIGAIKKVKSLNKQIYIVVVSVGRADNKIINMLKCGVDGYLILSDCETSL